MELKFSLVKTVILPEGTDKNAMGWYYITGLDSIELK